MSGTAEHLCTINVNYNVQCDVTCQLLTRLDPDLYTSMMKKKTGEMMADSLDSGHSCSNSKTHLSKGQG